jgi:hypothetical protein
MKGKNDLRIKRKLGVLGILGILMTVALSSSVTAFDPGESYDVDDEQYIGLDTASDGRINFDDLATDEIEIMDANVGIGDTSPDGIFEVNPDGTEDNGDEIVVDTNGRLGIGDTSPDFKLEVTGSSGSGYFGVSSSSSRDLDILGILALFF